MSGVERLLRETLRSPELTVTPGVGLLDRARYDGQRLRRRRRCYAVMLSTAATLAIVGTGAAFSPHLFAHPLLAQPAAGGTLHVAVSMPAPPSLGVVPRQQPNHGAVPRQQPSRPTLWTEQVAGGEVTVVARYDGHRLCIQPASAADVAVRPPVCADRAERSTGLLTDPVGGPTGVAQADAALSRVVVVAGGTVASVVVRVPGGDTYVGYMESAVGGGRLFDVVLPLGLRVAEMDAFNADGRRVGKWTPGL